MLKFIWFFRFKQLKEQEARRKREREEEKRKAEEVAVMANGEQKGEDNQLERDGGNGAATVNDRDERVQSVSTDQTSSNSGVILKGNVSGEDLEKDKIEKVLLPVSFEI